MCRFVCMKYEKGSVFFANVVVSRPGTCGFCPEWGIGALLWRRVGAQVL